MKGRLAELEHNLTSHQLDEAQGDRADRIRMLAKAFGFEILENTPPGREQSLAITSLEQTVFWAVASIAREAS